MHVLFIPSWYPAQPGDINGCFFREQALALAASGARVGVLTPALRSLTSLASLRGDYGLDIEDDEGVPTYRWHGVRAFSWNHSLNMLFWERVGLRAFAAYTRDHGMPDLIQVHGMIFGLAWASAIHNRHATPFVVTEHSTEFALGAVRPRLLAYLTAQVQHAGRLFAVSGDLARRLTALVPPPSTLEWTPMPNLVDATFTVQPEGAATRLREGRLRLLNVGILHPKKGQRRLIEALRLLIDAGIDAELRICGNGAEAVPLRELTQALNLQDRVTFLGDCSRAQVQAEMGRCDVFVLSSLYETFGVVVIEALASGKPVVATRCGGPDDIVEPGRDGLLVEKDSATALAEGLREIATMLPTFDAADLRSRCVARFSSEAFVERYLSAYRTTVAAAQASDTPENTP